MFGQKTEEQNRVPAASQEVFDHRGNVKVLQLDINAKKAEKQLTPWIGYGWTVTSMTQVALLGQTAFLVATLEKRK
jgi:hypothetical protein